METLKLQTNVPETIALKFATGLAVESKFGGDQVCFTLTDGRRAYLAPYVAQKIADAGITAGELFTITKRETVQGNRRSVDYQISTDVELPAVQAPAAPVAPASARNNGPVQHNAAVSTAARGYVPAAGAAVHPAPAPAIEDAFTATGKSAIDAVLIVEEYARSRGMVDFAFGAQNIQALWATMFINSQRGGGRA